MDDRKNLPDYAALSAVNSQRPKPESGNLQKRSCFIVHDGDKMFRLEPDLLLESYNHKWVLDTKWKKLNAADRSNKYGLSQGDFYQLYAYGKKYLTGQVSSELVLIYPATDSFAKSLPVFDYGDGMKLWVLPFDLTDQVLIDSEQTTLPIGFHVFEKMAA